MDSQKFIQQLPNLSPSPDFQEILNQTQGITSLKIMQLLNLAVSCLEADEIYCQIGCAEGTNLIAALLNNPEKIAYGVDNTEKIEQLNNNLSAFNLEEQVIFCHQDFEEFCFDLREYQPETQIGVYLLNNPTDYRTGLMGLLQVRHFLAAKALIIVSNSNNTAVEQATWDFLAVTTQCEQLLELPNLRILGWDINKLTSYSWGDWTEKCRHEPFIQAFSDFQVNWELENTVKTLYNSALSLAKSGKLIEAAAKYKEVLNRATNHAPSWHDLGMVLCQMGQKLEALKAVEKAITINPSLGHYYYSLGLVQEEIGEKQQAISAYQQAIKLNPKHFDAYNNLGNIFYATNQQDKAESIYRQALEVNSEHFGSYLNLFLTLESLGNTEEARKLATAAAQLFPHEFWWQLKQHLTLPILYKNQAEINLYRQQFTEGLEQISQLINLETPAGKNKALEAIGKHTNFYLSYQGRNDLKLQQKYGKMVQQIMAANYPQWSSKPPFPPLSQGKIKVGYISEYLRDHTVGKLYLGWLKNHNLEKFEVYCYYPATIVPPTTQQYREYSNVFYQLPPDDLAAICQQIMADQLHLLVYLDIGMFSRSIQLAGLRLAPVQCMTWGHPITSGTPTIDYFLSSELMEPENAQEHYAEKLILLPNISISYAKPVMPNSRAERSFFQLRSDAIVYLSCQSLYKYLPQYDYIFPAIAQRVPQAQFAFISNKINSMTDIFNKRLKAAFAKLNLNSEDYCVFAPRLDYKDYLNLNLVSDIYLDTISWSGGNTTLEAIASNLPVVTYPGEFMRGRHSYGILKMLGVTDTIATSEAEYIEIAVKLGNNPQWRQSIREKIEANHPNLYDDPECVRALEEFYQSVVFSHNH